MSESRTAAQTGTRHYRPETRLVHGGTLRSQFGETSEALFLTQGYIYDTAEQCAAAVQPAIDECVKDQECSASSGLDQCDPNNKNTYQGCIDAASAAYLACMGPPPPESQPSK